MHSKKPVFSQRHPRLFKLNDTAGNDLLHRKAFENSAQPGIIFTVNNDKVIAANNAACRLLGYSNKTFLKKTAEDIIDLKEQGFKKTFGYKKNIAGNTVLLPVIKKNGTTLPCEITTSFFKDAGGSEKAIMFITDTTRNMLAQKKIDTKNEKIVASNIVLAQSKQKKIDTKKERVVAGNIILAKSKQKKIDTKKEKVVADNIVLAKSKQKKIDTKKEKIVADNIVLAAAKSTALLNNSNEWVKYISKSSYDIMWDWDIASNEIYVGDSIKEVFGYSIKNNHVRFEDFMNCLLATEKIAVDKGIHKRLQSKYKTWKDTFSFKRDNGTIAATSSRANIIRDKNGKAIRLIGATQDVSRLKELEKKLLEQTSIKEELNEIFLGATKLSFDGIWDWNLLTNEFFLGNGFEELFGYKKQKGTSIVSDWTKYIHADDLAAVEKQLKKVIASSATRWEYTYRFIRADGSVAKVFNRASIIRDKDGKAYRMIGAMQDLSKQSILEEKLEEEIKLKKTQIKQASEDARNTERSDIAKELHDNVNQLLGASKMYLEMGKKGGGKSSMYLSRSSEYTLTAIEEIRKLTKALTTDIIKNLGLCEAIENISLDTMEISPVKIYCECGSFDEKSANDKFKLNLFRIVQEQLNNILKHAAAKNIRIILSQTKKNLSLVISDNGVGFDVLKKRTGIGIANIKSRATVYNGIADFISQPGKGCSLLVTFPLKNLSQILD